MTVRGIIFDYGGTLDTRSRHWSEVLRDGYHAVGLHVTREEFWDAYVHAERELAKSECVRPHHTMLTLLRTKVSIELSALGLSQTHAEPIAQWCYAYVKEVMQDTRPVLASLSKRYPMVVVSNFYGNLPAVLQDFGIAHFFQAVVESATVGIRKPDPRIFRLGVEALALPPEQVVVVGDSEDKDIRPAAAIGCQTLLAMGGVGETCAQLLI